MPALRGARRGFIGLPGPRARHRHEQGEAYGDLATRYAEAVRRHDDALAELRQVTDAMAEAARSPSTPTLALSLAPAPRHAEAPGDEGVYAIANPGEAPAAEPEPAAEKSPRRSRHRGSEEPPDPDRPANLRCERSDETGSMCLTWDGTPRKGLIFGVWRSVAREQGPPGAFERLAMIRETGFIDTTLPDDALRVSYAVRAMVGRRPVPGSTHLCVRLDDSAPLI